MSLIFYQAENIAKLTQKLIEEKINKNIVVCFENQNDANNLRCQLAKENPALSFGVTISSWNNFIENNWELYGDGRTIVSRWQRYAFLAEALKKSSFENSIAKGGLTSGKLKALESLVVDSASCLPLRAYLFENSSEIDFSQTEKDMLDIAYLYYEILKEHNLCELADASFILAEILPREVEYILIPSIKPNITWAHFISKVSINSSISLLFWNFDHSDFDPSMQWKYYLDAFKTKYCDKEVIQGLNENKSSKELDMLKAKLFEQTQTKPLLPEGKLQFLFPAGQYAENSLYAQVLNKKIESDEKCLFLVSHPFSLYQEIMAQYPQAGVHLSYSVCLEETSLYSAIKKLLIFSQTEEECSQIDLSDVLFTPLFQKSVMQAYDLVDIWKADRLTTKEDMFEDICEEDLSVIEEVILDFRNKNYLKAFNNIQSFLHKQMLPLYLKEEYKAVVASLTKAFEEIVKAKADPLQFIDLIEKQAIVLDYKNAQNPNIFITNSFNAEETATLYNVIVLGNLNASESSVRSRLPGHAALLKKVDYPIQEDKVFELRYDFLQVLNYAGDTLILERSLNNAEAAPENPLFLLDDISDCYRESLSDFSEIDKTTLLPKVLLPYVRQESESAFSKLLYRTQGSYNLCECASSCEQEEVSEDLRLLVNIPIFYKNDEGDSLFYGRRFSPSAIEAFLECPYKWFYERRLRLGEPGEGFSVCESGIFAHDVLNRFYSQLSEKLHIEKITDKNLNEAIALFDDIFDTQLALQKTLDPFEYVRYIPINEIELHEAQILKDNLRQLICQDAYCFKEYKPSYFEFPFGEDGSFEYAGVAVSGIIDRIDVKYNSITGKPESAIIIDYKSSKSDRYNLRQKVSDINVFPEKIQTLIYAQAVRKILGIKPVAALYFSLQDANLRGAFDEAVLDPSDLAGISLKKAGIRKEEKGSMEEYLDWLEEGIAKKLIPLKKGIINPCGEENCEYCARAAVERKNK